MQHYNIFSIKMNINESSKEKLKSKVPIIKKLIALDPFHPGSLSPQQITKKNGKKSKKYWSWQSSFHGVKKSFRVPDSQVETIKKLIASAKKKASTMERRDSSELKSYEKAYEELLKMNSKIRKANGDNPLEGKTSK